MKRGFGHSGCWLPVNKDEGKKQDKNVRTDWVIKLKHLLHFSLVLIWTHFQMFKIVKCEKLNSAIMLYVFLFYSDCHHPVLKMENMQVQFKCERKRF